MMWSWPVIKAAAGFASVAIPVNLAVDTGTPSLGNPAVWVTPAAVVAAIASGLLVPGTSYKREKEENDRKQQIIEEKLFPLTETYATTMLRAAETLDKATAVLKAIESERQAEAIARTMAVPEGSRGRGWKRFGRT